MADPEAIKKFKEDYPHLSNLSLLNMMLRLCHVPRWSVIPMGRQQTVAEHSFRVAAIAVALGDRICSGNGYDGHISMLYEAAWASLTHDCEEAVGGDIPSPYRKLMGVDHGSLVRELCPNLPPAPSDKYVAWLVKMADMIEATTYLRMWGRSVDGVDIREVRAANISNHLGPRLDTCPFENRQRVEGIVFRLIEEICVQE